jgi:hypothetical protein
MPHRNYWRWRAIGCAADTRVLEEETTLYEALKP